MSILDRTQVNGGNVGAATATGDAVNTGFDTKIGLSRAVIGQRIVLGDRTQAGDLFVTTLVAPAATFASRSAFSPPPAPPPIPTFTAGTSALTVNGGQSLTQAAGNFGAVTVNGTLNLSGGTYQFQNLTLGPDGALIATSPSIVHVAGRVSGGDRSHISSATTAGALRVFVAGATDTTGGVVLGNDARVNALVVSRAIFQAGDRLIASGAVAARDIALAHDSVFTFDTGFGCNSNVGCDDGNPCTTDSCVDAQCQHTAVANGTSCSDSNACTGADHCQAGTCVSGPPVTCDDGLFCNGAESCSPASGCVAGTPPSTSDGVACTDDVCNEGAKRIDHVPNNANCPSGFACNATAGCVDIDECANGTANCDINATCHNTSGGFTCTCNTGFTGDGTTCTEACIPMTVGFGVQRCVLARQDGTVDLFLNPDGTNLYQDRADPDHTPPPLYLQQDEPHENFCGPTAGKNMLFWYGGPAHDPDYNTIAAQMKADTWDDSIFQDLCVATCLPIDLPCLAACEALAAPAFSAFVQAGTLPGDMNSTMDSLKPPGYVRCSNGDDITLPQLQWSLAHGNPVIYLESREENQLHWAVIGGLHKFPHSSDILLRFLNDPPDLDFPAYQAIASIENVSQGIGSSLVKGFLDDVLGVNPTIIRYAKATDVLPGNVCDDWHHNNLTDAAGDQPVAGNSVVGYATSFNGQNQQHVDAIGTDFHVHELLFTDHWQPNDLTLAATTATQTVPNVAANSPLVAYLTTFNGQQHISFIDANSGHVWELFFAPTDQNWHANDLTNTATTSTGAHPPAPKAGSPLTGFTTDDANGQQQQHVDFIDAQQGHVWELFFSTIDQKWHANDLTNTAKTATGGAPPLPRTNSPLTGYQTPGNNQQHINYIDAVQGHVWELFFAPTDQQWHADDLSATAKTATGAAPSAPDANSPLTAFVTTSNGQQHVDFIDGTGHVWELFFSPIDQLWHANDLNMAAGIPDVAAATGALHGYTTSFNPGGMQQHLNFLSSSTHHVFELFFAPTDQMWHARDLTMAPAPPAPAARVTTLLAGYESAFNSQEHVDYIGADGKVHELFL